MKIFLLIIIFVAPIFTRSYPEVRIIGGRDAYAGEFPFSAAITSQTHSGLYFCGGALLNNDWIITAGSCVNGSISFSIRLGNQKLNASDVLKVSSDTYVLHPDYDPNTLDSDIGLIRLRVPIEYTDYIQPIELPLRELQQYAVVSAIGWGQISDDDSSFANNLQTVQLTVLSNEECRLSYGYQITDNMVCVDGSYNQGTCLGDTGSPLIQYVNGHRAHIAAISSFVSGNGCESPDPSGYTRVYPYIDWIKNNTNIV